MQTKYVIFLILMLLNSVNFAKDIRFESGDYQNTLIELYTSEGCSSCPPADRWLSELKHHPKLFSEIVPVAFHVDYWDYIGWKDRFANRTYTKRQRQHYQQKNISQIYTPGMLKNGEEDRSWRYQRNMVLPSKEVGKLSVHILDDTAYIRFKPKTEYSPLIVHVALLGFELESKITAGENHNKTLKHDFVVLNYAQQSSKANRWSVELPQPSQLAKRFALAVWVSTQESLKPIQVTGSWL